MRKRKFSYDPNAFQPGFLQTGGRNRRERRGNRYLPIKGIKVVACSMAAIALFAFVSPRVFANPFKTVQITDGYGEYTLLTKADTVGELVQSGALNLGTGDAAKLETHESVSEGMEVSVDRAISVSVLTKDETATVKMKKGTVREALELADVEYSEEDKISPSLDEELSNGDAIQHIAVNVKTVTKREVIPFDTVRVEDSSLPAGTTQVAQEGQNGYKNVEYSITFEDDEEVSREVAGETVIQQPTDRKILVGTGQETPSTTDPGNNGNSGNENNHNNNNNNNGGGTTKPPTVKPSIPSPSEDLDEKDISTTKLMSSTGYSHTGRPTASGAWPTRGTVAVNTSEIPLGTRLYIPGYGFGVAQDTGGMGANTIDLFFETTAEALVWGRRSVTVYILK